MSVDKITVSLPRELVGEIDRLSARDGVSRSAVVREAAAQYVSERESAREAEHRRSAADGLLHVLAEMDRAVAADERPVLNILRELRGPLDDLPGR